MKNALLDALIGCRIQTHYGTGGVVVSYSGPWDEVPWGKNCWTIRYLHDGDRSPTCYINSIKIEGGVITCEGKPLRILGRERNVQMSLF